MKELIIISDKPIYPERCSEALINAFNNHLLLANNDQTLYIKKSKSGFELWYSPDDVLDDPINMMGETVDKCPNKKAHLTNLRYTSYYIANKVVQVLKPKFGNMWIELDDETGWFGTADEFLELNLK